MASLLPGYEYDIFISYRHNDNLDGWVSEFVLQLEKELRSTVKDQLSIYFDKNPHDGLLETHHVDKSLTGKLKCLVFIPIISQTYCDPKSFAWQHEFCAFNLIALQDAYGRDIRLGNGNVTSRILPVRIHDIDSEDKAAIERELKSVLRSIDFIYRAPGVNRPLRDKEESPQDNLNKTYYRDQVNKVANSVKEIVAALKNPVVQSSQQQSAESPSAPSAGKSNSKIWIAVGILALILGFAGMRYFGSTSNPSAPSSVEKSVAVLPFVDMSESKDQEWFSDGLTEEILNSLAHLNDLKVISRTSSFAFKGKNLQIQTIADSLHVNYVVEGSVRKSSTGLRITAQLIRANDGVHLWSSTFDRVPTDILSLQQEIATKVAENLNVSLDAKSLEQMQRAGTKNPEAYLLFLKGMSLFSDAHGPDMVDLKLMSEGNKLLTQSTKQDPAFASPDLYIADFYLHYISDRVPDPRADTLTDEQSYNKLIKVLSDLVDKAGSPAEKDYYRLYVTMFSRDWSNFRPLIERVLNNPESSKYFAYQSFNLGQMLIALGYQDEMISISKTLLQSDPSNGSLQIDLATALISKGKYEEFISEKGQTLSLEFRERTLIFLHIYSLLKLDRLSEAEELLTKLDPDNVRAYWDLRAMIAFRQGHLEEALGLLSKRSTHRSSGWMFATDALLGREAANKEAAHNDRRIALDFSLFLALALSPNKLPYDLSVAPNFAQRLKEAGSKK
ncbi:MAG TPA: hypothetical protein PLX35_06740 [Cyclobacteriaceae bacterium]|nr:hypothetical protein [Cyclobacteriaceae bacterium]